MNSVILQTATRLLIALIMLLAIFLTLRGHNMPGGGFIGGLVAAIAFALYTIAFGVKAAKYALRFSPRVLIGIGLSFAVSSGFVAAFVGAPYLTGVWTTLYVGGQEFKIGTPIFFDLGVFFVVAGIALMMLFALEEA
ncbi:MAG: Na+/H+ antiporter subunit B [Trueperaceae bacterium]